MKEVLFPVLLSALVIPGAGQLYNKEKAKGWVLMLLTAAVTLSFFFGLTAAVARVLPATPSILSTEEIKAIVTRVMTEHETFVSSFGWLTTGIWVYSVLDAYWGARSKRGNTSKAE